MCTHCWHTSPLQHAVTNHMDFYCCYCGVNDCRTFPARVDAARHGPFLSSRRPEMDEETRRKAYLGEPA